MTYEEKKEIDDKIIIKFRENDKKKRSSDDQKALDILAKVFDDIFNEGDDYVEDDI